MSLMKNLETSSIDNVSDNCFLRGRERDNAAEKGLERVFVFVLFRYFL